MRFASLFFFCTAVLFQLAQAQTNQITIPAQGAVGQCSNSSTTQASFIATVNAPGVKGIYLLPLDDYNMLINASRSATPQNVQFQYFIQFSCATGSVTSCQKNTGSTSLPLNVTCVAFVNELNQTLSGTLQVDFTTNSPLSASSGAKVGGLWAATIVAAGVGLAAMF